MPTNALPPPVLRGVFEDCTLNNACYSPVEDDIAAVGPSTSMFDDQLSFIDDEFFQEDYKDSKYEFVVENFPRCYEKYIESAPFDDGADGDLKWRLRIYPCCKFFFAISL
ncbi:hypothetical protein Tcan_16780 [Toxocara canis]|uniref:MATH domain-containing protein n=1 Tax=Toxocara canis TaxID=6265 RepID=A0A0B2UXD3_TOXCA|nr:hypothetical protein Tcan_16780 [Toxocara canis]